MECCMWMVCKLKVMFDTEYKEQSCVVHKRIKLKNIFAASIGDADFGFMEPNAPNSTSVTATRRIVIHNDTHLDVC